MTTMQAQPDQGLTEQQPPTEIVMRGAVIKGVALKPTPAGMHVEFKMSIAADDIAGVTLGELDGMSDAPISLIVTQRQLRFEGIDDVSEGVQQAFEQFQAHLDGIKGVEKVDAAHEGQLTTIYSRADVDGETGETKCEHGVLTSEACEACEAIENEIARQD